MKEKNITKLLFGIYFIGTLFIIYFLINYNSYSHLFVDNRFFYFGLGSVPIGLFFSFMFYKLYKEEKATADNSA